MSRLPLVIDERESVMSSKTLIDLYFDVISPYSLIAFESLLRYENHWPIKVNLIPFFLGGIMKESGNKPAMMVAAKMAYMSKDLRRNADYWGVNLVPPKDLIETVLNRGSLLPQRFLTAIDLQNKSFVEAAARELWARLWARNETIHTVDDIKQVAVKISLPNAEDLIAASNSTLIKETLKKRNNMALQQGCFGAPWIVVHKGEHEECFFGSDRIHLIADMIGCKFDGPHLPQHKI
uniref:Glutathione S-transferase kappa n=1 Tax=Parascaris univalens TaxID=6257 RepID=A0A914ZHQ8_PARUN